MDTTRFGNLKTPIFTQIICIMTLVLAGTTVKADNVPTHGANKHLDPLNTGNQIDKYAQVGGIFNVSAFIGKDDLNDPDLPWHWEIEFLTRLCPTRLTRQLSFPFSLRSESLKRGVL